MPIVFLPCFSAEICCIKGIGAAASPTKSIENWDDELIDGLKLLIRWKGEHLVEASLYLSLCHQRLPC